MSVASIYRIRICNHVIVLAIVFRLSLPTGYTTIQNGYAEFKQFYVVVHFLLLSVFDKLYRLTYVK